MARARNSKHHHTEKKSSLPGVQKIKSTIRQTTRFLAKDNIKADVRVETERRLASLRADLAQAEQARQEQAVAVRYHKVKFFEKKKACRKINRVKRDLAQNTAEMGTRRKLEESLFEYRVDLNYILHFPKLKKYVSLFPPAEATSEATSENTSSSKSTSDSTSETDAIRQEVRNWVRTSMISGALHMEPELALEHAPDHHKEAGRFNTRPKKDEDGVGEEQEESDFEE